MAEPPVKPQHVPGKTQAELWALYKQHGFAEKLPQCKKIELCNGPRKPEDTFHSELTEHELGIKYIDQASNESIAVIFTYTNLANEKSTTIRMLRVDNTIYDAKVRKQ